MTMEQEAVRRDYKSYDYKQVAVREDQISFFLDCYENFGWVLDENRLASDERGQKMLRLKRDRKIANKTELTRLQRNFEACVAEVDKMEASKTRLPAIVSLSCGIIGTAFVAGATFAATADPPIVWLCVLLAIPGFLGWILPYFIYRKGVEKETAKVTPFIEAKQDEIDEICKKGYSLL